ncbi:nitrate- and nitrite sensing domain-containing protein [Streptomyces sp. NPDC060064]|uniref:sensor histidine kinase n=1 Tax=Streptomyces sp. NPDC060064 TaxID=3347049 RepID=UPI0036B9F2B8
MTPRGSNAASRHISTDTPTTESDSGDQPRSSRARRRTERQLPQRGTLLRLARFGDWPVSGKLAAAVLIPTTLAVALVASTVAYSIGQANDYGRLATLARLQQRALPLVSALQTERDLTACFIAGRRKTRAADVGAQQKVVDRVAGAYARAAQSIDSDGDRSLQLRLDRTLADIRGLPSIRAAARNASLTESSILAQYTAAVTNLLDMGSGLATQPGGQALIRDIRSFDLIARATEYASQERAQLGSALTTGYFQVGQAPEYTGLAAPRQQATDQFLASMTSNQRTLYADTVKGTSVVATKHMQDRVTELADADRLGLKAGTWWKASTDKLALMRKVEERTLDDLTARADRLTDTQQQEALHAALELLATLIAALAVSLTVVRAMTRPLHRLRTSALEVADHRLPAIEERLRQAAPDDLSDIEAVPTGVTSGDEIGEVARSFEAVQHAALKLATDQAALRISVNAMFVHMSRRSQTLVHRLLGEIGTLEQTEADPDRLNSLFKLDHLATRMLRTGEGLLVLGGSDSGRGRQNHVPLVETLLAASSEVEQYTRIVMPRQVPDVAIAGPAVVDVVHLLAELMENATVFSRPSAQVTITCYINPGRRQDTVVLITDHGIGMAPDLLRTLNQRLATPPPIGPEVVRTMGLFVVGQLAAKHGIQVRLARPDESKTVATVLLPGSLIVPHTPQQPLSHRQPAPGPQAQPRHAGVPRQATRSPSPPAQPTQPPAPCPSSPNAPDTSDAAAPAFSSQEAWREHRRWVEDEAAFNDENDPGPA